MIYGGRCRIPLPLPPLGPQHRHRSRGFPPPTPSPSPPAPRSFLSDPWGRTWRPRRTSFGQSCLFWHDFVIGWALLVCGSQFGAFTFSIGLSQRYFSIFGHSTSVAYLTRSITVMAALPSRGRPVACVRARALVRQRHQMLATRRYVPSLYGLSLPYSQFFFAH
jgi:hypothetical protein